MFSEAPIRPVLLRVFIRHQISESQRVEADYFLCQHCNGIFENATRVSVISLELHVEMHIETYCKDDEALEVLEVGAVGPGDRAVNGE